MKKRKKVKLNKSKKSHGLFPDKIPVHTTSSGAQYVLPIDLLLDQDDLEALRQVAADKREQKREAACATE